MADKHSFQYRLTQEEMPKPFTTGTRLVVYGVIVLFVLPFIVGYFFFRHGTQRESCATNAAMCLDKSTGILRSMPALERKDVPGTDKMRIPCRYVGIWTLTKDAGTFEVALNFDGTYDLHTPLSPGLGGAKGWWAVQGDYMVWRPEGYLPNGKLDVNRILLPTDSSFVLAEIDGKFTKFELNQKLPSQTCSR